jgi:hypothetical protein
MRPKTYLADFTDLADYLQQKDFFVAYFTRGIPSARIIRKYKFLKRPESV